MAEGLAIPVARTGSPPRQFSRAAAKSVPRKASRGPFAPPRIRIAVEGHRLPESDQAMGYGILCRINGANAYVLTISDETASIEKWGRYKPDGKPKRRWM